MLDAGVERGAGFRHEAMLYAGEHDFLGRAAAFIEDGVAAGEPTLVVVDRGKIARLRERLRSDSALVAFVDMSEVGANPAHLIPALRGFVDGHPADQALRVMGEVIWPGQSEDALAECHRHEALANMAFAGSNLWAICPYDVSALDAATITAAERHHPLISDSGAPRLSRTYPGDERLAAPFEDALPEVPAAAIRRSFGAQDLSGLRSWVAATARTLGLTASGAEDLVLAASEIATNSVRYGGGGGVMRIWPRNNAVVCEVEDRGGIDDPLAGRRKPGPDQKSGYGLWIANQLCDLVQIRTYPNRSVVRLHVNLHR